MDKAGAEAKMIATTNQTCFVDSGLEKGHTYAYSIQVNMESEPKNFQEQITAMANKLGVLAEELRINLTIE